MSADWRRIIMLADGLFLVSMGAVGAVSDVVGSFWGIGPAASILIQLPAAGVGFLEAHGLAVISGVQLLRPPRESLFRQHAVAVAVHVLLGTCNLLFWRLVFEAFGMLAMGYATTALHIAFAGLQLFASVRSYREIAVAVTDR